MKQKASSPGHQKKREPSQDSVSLVATAAGETQQPQTIEDLPPAVQEGAKWRGGNIMVSHDEPAFGSQSPTLHLRARQAYLAVGLHIGNTEDAEETAEEIIRDLLATIPTLPINQNVKDAALQDLSPETLGAVIQQAAFKARRDTAKKRRRALKKTSSPPVTRLTRQEIALRLEQAVNDGALDSFVLSRFNAEPEAAVMVRELRKSQDGRKVLSRLNLDAPSVLEQIYDKSGTVAQQYGIPRSIPDASPPQTSSVSPPVDHFFSVLNRLMTHPIGLALGQAVWAGHLTKKEVQGAIQRADIKDPSALPKNAWQALGIKNPDTASREKLQSTLEKARRAKVQGKGRTAEITPESADLIKQTYQKEHAFCKAFRKLERRYRSNSSIIQRKNIATDLHLDPHEVAAC